ncbi:hypothetical protein [Ferrimonas pelagia]|uniref:hypothetical protein n=1 Tax=Ferrimonas pelagia TaxID=1177826 RepID=UPI0031ED9EF0
MASRKSQMFRFLSNFRFCATVSFFRPLSLSGFFFAFFLPNKLKIYPSIRDVSTGRTEIRLRFTNAPLRDCRTVAELALKLGLQHDPFKAFSPFFRS